MTTYTKHLDAFVDKLEDKSLDFQAKHSLFSELCDTLETYHGPNEYEYFLKKLLDVFFNHLKTVPISFVSNSPEQKLRYLILDIIHRLPVNDTFQPYAMTVSDNLMSILKEDNEENGLQCMKIITSLHKSYKNYMSSKVEEYMDFLKSVYTNFFELVKDQFGNLETVEEKQPIMLDIKNEKPCESEKDNDQDDFASTDESSVAKTLFKATHSFKMAAECPITLVSLYTTYKTLIDSTVNDILPLVIDVLKVQAPAQKKQHELSLSENSETVKIDPKLHNNPVYNDFNFAQVKATSFMAYVFLKKSSATSLETYQHEIPDIIIRLLQDCPRELSSARRELLHATRHVLSTNMRVLFLPKIDLLFDDNILIGDGLTAHETLRPLGYPILADLIHVNNSLTLEQIAKSVKVFSGYLQDDTLPQTVHIMSAKLLLNLMDRILKLENKENSRHLLLLIIDTFGKRFRSLNYQYDNIMKQHEEYKNHKKEKALKLKELEKFGKELTGRSLDENYHIRNLSEKLHLDEKSTSKEMDVDNEIDLVTNLSFAEIERNLPIQTTQHSLQDPLDSARYLFRTLMTFLKSICFAFKNCNQLQKENTTVLSLEELNIFRRLFKESISGLKFFQSSKISTITTALKQTYEISGPNLPITSSKEEKDLMEILATIFIYLDPAAFNEVVQSEITNLFNATLENPALLHMPQFFLANEVTTSNFSSLLIVFVISKLDELGNMDIVKANIVIRLFKLCFMSVNLFPALNENVILPHLNKLILDCLNYSMKTKEPIVYFYLIRTLFRSIGGGRFESLYKEVLPLLHVLLETLNRLVETARRPHERDIYVELCLTVPVRLSVLVPYLSYLMKPLVFALEGSQELISQGLRTLELCVDNLTAEYFDPIIEPVLEDVMKALWKHLKPLPYYHQHSHTTLRILGKLGGRNRSFMNLHNDLTGEILTEQKLDAMFKIEGISGEVPVSVTPAIGTALNTLESVRYKLHYRVSAYQYLTTVLKLLVNADDLPENYETRVQQVVNFIKNEGKEPLNQSNIHLVPDDTKSADKFDREEELLTRLLKSLFFSVSLEEVKDESYKLIEGICQHYVLLSLSKAMIDHHKISRRFLITNHEGKNYLNTNTIYEVISYALSHYITAVSDAGKFAIKVIFDTCVSLFGSIQDALKFMSIRRMCSNFIHRCFESAYYDKLGGCLGLKIMINELGIPYQYFGVRQLEISRAMFFVLRDTPEDVPSEVCTVAKSIILDLLRNCNKEISKEDVFQKSFQSIVSQIVFDLSNSNSKVRETAKEALAILSEATSVPVATMISPSKGILLAPIFGKPLRALPFHMQIGNIDAIAFCLGLDDTFLEFNEELNRLLSEALALVDADDESLINVNKISEHTTAEQLINLRIVCIELLSLALTKKEFSNNTVRIRILSVFFKTLCSKSTRIINAAHQGLKRVLSQNSKLPKELLQSGLRPMLMNLSDYKKLTVSGLEALSRLLELLISYFKVEIGRKLLDHLMAWAQPAVLHRISSQELDSNNTIQIIVAILKIFHLLPPQAFTFLKELMKTLLFLETNLRRHYNSPFRKPIASFLNCFSDHSINFMKEHFATRDYGFRFAYFIGLNDCDALRNEFKKNIETFMELIVNEPNNDIKCIKLVNMIESIESLSNNDAEWFAASGELLQKLCKISMECTNYEKNSFISCKIHFQLDQSTEKLQKIYTKYLQISKKSTDVVNFIDYICTNKLPFCKEIDSFLLNDIIKSDNVPLKTEYLNDITKFITDENYQLETKVYLLKHIAIPLCYFDAKNNANNEIAKSGTEPADWLKTISEKIWKSGIQSPKLESCIADKFRVQLLQFTSLLVTYYSDAVLNYKKDIIKFNWNFISLEDNIAKQAAYISTVHFIRAFNTPAKVVIQVFVALLKTNQTDVRYMIRQSLDLLAPFLNERLGTDDEWLKWTRRILSEDGFVVTQVSNIYQVIVNHPDLFYASRDQFIPNIITAMGKLTVINNSTTENQILAIDLAELILQWEVKAKRELEEKQKQAVYIESNEMEVDDKPETENKVSETNLETETNVKPDPAVENKNENNDESEVSENTETKTDEVKIEDNDAMDVDNDKPETETKNIEGALAGDQKLPLLYSVPFGQRDTSITFLIRYVCLCSQRASENELGRRALNILHILLSPEYWPDVSVKLIFFEKFLINSDSNVSNMLVYCLNALEVLNITLEWKPSEWVIANLSQLQKLLEKCIKSNNHDIQEALQSVLLLILQACQIGTVPSEEEDAPDDEATTFIKFLVAVIAEDLSNMNSVAAGITLLSTVSGFRPELLDPQISLIIRTLGKLVKDHVTLSHQGKQHSAENNTSEYEAKMTTKLVEKILDFGASRITVLGDQRRIYLSLLVQLVDKSIDKELLTKISSIVRTWLFTPNLVTPTVKEKAGILSKMMIYELKGDVELTKTYYQIIMDIFKDESLNYSELTFRLEHPFLVGTKISDVGIRQELMNILNNSLDKDIRSRLFYIIREQNWEYLSEYPWLNQASQILYGSFDQNYKLKVSENENTLASLDEIETVLPGAAVEVVSSDISKLLLKHQTFIDENLKITASHILTPLLDISYQSPDAIHKSWCNLFPVAYNSIELKERSDFIYSFITLLSKDYHMRQQEGKPNVINTMLTAAGKCVDLQLPPHLVKYLSINYDAWYSGVRILEQIDAAPIIENSKIKETNKDALVEMYSNLQEDDMFYGLWRRRSKYFETNAALSYEQIGLWDKAMKLYESAQVKARSSILPYSESEYALWEDDWILCAEKLQCWDLLTELAKHEGFTDLLLECGWRVADWIADKEPLEQSTKTVMDVPTPRRQMFQTFLVLQSFAHNADTIQNVTRQVDEGIQLALRKWYTLPQRLTNAHTPLLHSFQQYVEFMEATQVYRSLQTTTAENLDVKSQDLKRVLQAWRERLPNTWDDINVWNDLVTWRKHAFEVINKVYIPLIPALQQNNSNNNSFAFRGYHEIAWVINRFAHVARKHNMPDVCIKQLTKIYTLPNIEIQEAFLKLREQAKCHYHNPAELNTGLDVISNTNLVYFAAQQKAEFITLKGMFLAKLNVADEANQAFATAVQLDLNLPKAWAEWGFFNDSRYKENNDINYAKHAISCYLQAASLYKNNKARRLLCRILWLISLDDDSNILTESFESHQGEMPVWYWITFIPQLLSALTQKEVNVARKVLVNIAKSYPQALHFQLRTTREDFSLVQRQISSSAVLDTSSNLTASENNSTTPNANTGNNPTSTNAESSNNADANTNTENMAVDNNDADANATGSNADETGNNESVTKPVTIGSTSHAGSPPGQPVNPALVVANKSLAYVDEIMGILKTAYPLLALSLESLVDQIIQRFKSNPDDDTYRLIIALYNDGVQSFNRLSTPKADIKLPAITEANLVRFAKSVLPKHIKPEFEADFIESKPDLTTYLSKLKKWKDYFEEKLDRTYGKVNLERICPHLSQFHHQKFEDIEIPGQYLLNKETNQYFIKIERFMPTIEMIRGPTACFKRITIRGNDGSLHKFAVQFPAARHCRREERIFQLFRLFNDQLSRTVQARRRNIEFTLPVVVPVSPHIRLMSDDDKYVNMLNIYERYCKTKGQDKDQPLAYIIEKIHAAYDPRLPRPDLLSIKTEILGAIQSLFVPNTVMKNYFLNYYPKFEDFWVFRKQFSSQYATFIFATYMLCINARQPQKIHIHQGSGRVWTSEMLPYKVVGAKTPHNIFANSSLDISSQRAAPMFNSLEMVPFRLTPNIQELIGPVGSEGILSMHMMIIAQCLADPQYEIEHFLNLFIRDEIQSWYAQRTKTLIQKIPNMREIVRVNVDYIIKRTTQLANTENYGQSVASQFVVNLITHAVNPRNLASTDTLWMPYL